MYKATQEQIEAWKKEHGQVHKITAEDENLAAYCRRPKRKEMSFLGQIKDPIKFNEKLLDVCWIAGDQEIKTDDNVFLGLSEKIPMLLEYSQVKLEKL